MGQFSRTAGNAGEPIRNWIDTIPNDGVIRYLGPFNGERIVLTNPKALAEVLVQKTYEFVKPPQLVRGIGRILGVGVFLAEGHEHKTQRKNLMPAFAFRHIKELYPIFWTKSRELMNVLSLECEPLRGDEGITERMERPQKPIDVNDWSSRAALDIIGVAGLGQDFHAIKNTDNELLATYKQLYSLNRSARIFAALSFVLPAWLIQSIPSRRNNVIQNASTTIKSACRKLILNAKEEIQEKKSKENILSVALDSGGFSDEDLVNQLMTFLLAGQETTASALAWAVYILCKNPNIQTRLHDEVRSALPDPTADNSKISASDIDGLPYLNAVCNEVLRLWPPVSLTLRVAANDTTIAGQHIPKDTTIFIVPWAINASKALWGDDAREFIPDRWLGPGKANTGGADTNYAYLTFLHGPRSCIGQSFAKGEFACLLAAWVWTFKTRFADETYEMKVKSGISAKPKDLKVYLEILDT